MLLVSVVKRSSTEYSVRSRERVGGRKSWYDGRFLHDTISRGDHLNKFHTSRKKTYVL